ncbi:MAG: hypothetical protein ABIS14_08440 [Sphingomonas sp.]
MNIDGRVGSLGQLKRRIAAIEGAHPASIAPRARLGHAGIDAAIGGGLARGRLHEAFALDPADAGSATGFVAMLTVRLGGGIVWLREDSAERQGGVLHAAGLREIGIDPARLVVVLLPDPLALLRAAADVMRCPEVGVAVIELHRNPRSLDLTATRRLALAAEGSGVTALLLRVASAPGPSAADTRWGVCAAASVALAANAPGHPAFDVALLRQRGGPAGERWQVEWDRDRSVLRTIDGEGAAVSGAVVPAIADRPADANAVAALYRTG